MIATHAGPAADLYGTEPLFRIPEIEQLAQEQPRCIKADQLQPGHMIVTGREPLERAVVLAVEAKPGGKSLKVLRRPFAGGTAAWRVHHTRGSVRVTGLANASSFTPELVPAVPLVGVPASPDVGDEIWSQSAVSFDTPAVLCYRRDAAGWVNGQGLRVDDEHVLKAVTNPVALAFDWYVYRRTGQLLELYVDGLRHHARRAKALQEGDRLPGFGRGVNRVLQVTPDTYKHRGMVEIVFEVERVSDYRSVGRYPGVVTGGRYSEWRREFTVLPVVPRYGLTM
jgi:hypothetical protein